ncbi:hypothetical protein GW17_00051829, partial [Ensete ventricosum]
KEKKKKKKKKKKQQQQLKCSEGGTSSEMERTCICILCLIRVHVTVLFVYLGSMCTCAMEVAIPGRRLLTQVEESSPNAALLPPRCLKCRSRRREGGPPRVQDWAHEE